MPEAVSDVVEEAETESIETIEQQILTQLKLITATLTAIAANTQRAANGTNRAGK